MPRPRRLQASSPGRSSPSPPRRPSRAGSLVLAVREPEAGYAKRGVVPRESSAELRKQVFEDLPPRGPRDRQLEDASPQRQNLRPTGDRWTCHLPPSRLKLEILGARRGQPQGPNAGCAQRLESARATEAVHPEDCRRKKRAGPGRRRGPPGRGATFPGEGGRPRRHPGPARSAQSVGDFGPGRIRARVGLRHCNRAATGSPRGRGGRAFRPPTVWLSG